MTDTIPDSLHAEFNKHYENLAIAESKLHFEISETAIHDARVAIRTINSLLITLQPVLKEKPTKEIRTQIRWLNQQFAQLRDLDVMISKMREYESTEYGSAIENLLIDQRAICEIKLSKKLEKPKTHRVITDLANFSRALPFTGNFARLKLENQVSAIQNLVGETWINLFVAISKLPQKPNSIQLHRVRILAKRCRYSYECANNLQVLDGQMQIDWAKKLQQYLGRVQDAATLTAWIRDQKELPMELKVLAQLQVQTKLPTRQKLINRLAEPVTINQNPRTNSKSVRPQVIDRTMQHSNAAV